MVSAKVVDPHNRRFESSSKWIWLISLTVFLVWAVLIVGFLHVTTPAKENGKPPVNAYDYGPSVTPTTLKVMTWNVLNDYHQRLRERAVRVVQTVLSEKVDAALLQEMTPLHLKIICKNREIEKHYTCIRGTNNSNVILFKKSRFDFKSETTIPFKNSSTRGLLKVELSLKSDKDPKIRLALLNTHLQPFPKESQTRIQQFNECIRYGNYPENVNVIFGGDMNLEDHEQSKLDTDDFKDVWNMCGSSESIRYTWDSTINALNRNALTRPEQKLKARYDRLYFLPSKPKTLEPIKLKLGGTEKIKGTDLFASDHWALIATFKLLGGSYEQYSCAAS